MSEANGYAEREQAPELVRRARKRHGLEPRTLAADKGYAAGAFLVELNDEEGIVPLIPMPEVPIKGTSEEARARRQAWRRRKSKRFEVAQRIRKRVEEINGWTKVIRGMRQSRHLGRWKIYQQALVVHAAYNLLRMARLNVLAQAA